MVAQTDSGSSSSLRGARPSSADSAKAKRARTKHACDECRRSQKKCDGDKPLCRRCYLNGTLCTYTPHKSRNQCPCTGQSEEGRGETSVPDVFVFAESSSSSFHTWSATTSPDQSPNGSEPALKTPPPTNRGQDTRFGPTQNAVLKFPVAPYESEIVCSSEATQRVHDIYNHRSYSVPNFPSVSTVTPSPPATEFSSYPFSASLPQRFVPQPIGAVELRENSLGRFGTDEADRALSVTYLSDHYDITSHDQELSQRSAESGTFFDISTRQGQQVSEEGLTEQQTSILALSGPANLRANDQRYDLRQYAMEHCSRGSNAIVSASISNGYSPNPDYTSDAYPQWPVHVHANGLSSSHECLPAVSLNAVQNTQHSAEAVVGYSISSHDEYPPRRFTGPVASLTPSSTRRQTSGMTLHDLPQPGFPHGHWMNGPVSPPLTGSYPSSMNPSPPTYGTNCVYDWSH